MDPKQVAVLRIERLFFQWADDCLARSGLMVDEQGRKVLARAIAAAVLRASLALARLSRGEAIADVLYPVQR